MKWYFAYFEGKLDVAILFNHRRDEGNKEKKREKREIVCNKTCTQ